MAEEKKDKENKNFEEIKKFIFDKHHQVLAFETEDGEKFGIEATAI